MHTTTKFWRYLYDHKKETQLDSKTNVQKKLTTVEYLIHNRDQTTG